MNEQIMKAESTLLSTVWLSRVALLTLALALFLPPALNTPFHSKGEPREALAAQAVLDGEFILPTRYGDEIITKPPLMYWLIAAFSSPEGEVSEFTSRLPSLCFSLLTLLLLFEFLRRETSLKHANLSALFLIGSALWYRSSIVARVDMQLSGLLFIAFIAFFIWERRNLSSVLPPLFIIASLIFAVLTKGPVALVLSGIIFSIFLLSLRYPIRKVTKKLSFIFLPTLLLSAVWYYSAYTVGGDLFLQTFFSENIGRFTGTMAGKGVEEPHQHSLLYLLAGLLAGMFPFSLIIFFLPWRRLCLRWNALPSWRDYLQRGARSFRAIPRAVQFSILIGVVHICFYAIPSSKRAEYLLPAYPFLATILAYLTLEYWQSIQTSIQKWSVALLCFILICSVGTLLTVVCIDYIDVPSGVRFYVDTLFRGTTAYPIVDSILLSLLFIGPMFVLSFFSRDSTKSGTLKSVSSDLFGGEYTLVASAFFFYLLTVFTVGAIMVPAFGEALSSKAFAEEISPILSDHEQVLSTARYYPLNFYLNRKLKLGEVKKTLLLRSQLILSDDSSKDSWIQALPPGLQLKPIATSDNNIRKPGRKLYLLEIQG